MTRPDRRRTRIGALVVVALIGTFLIVQWFRPLPAVTLGGAEPSITLSGRFTMPWPEEGQAAVHIVGSGSLATFGAQKPVPIASVAKIMTAYVILKSHPLDKDEPGPAIEVDAKAVEDGKSVHESRIEGLSVGEKFSQQDMLEMLLIPSGNNVARLLARWDAGSDSVAPFVAKMNEAAKELGMRDTTYTDPSGLDSKTMSTAVDQLKLAEAVMKFPVFRAIVAMPSAEIDGLATPLVNNNDLLVSPGLSVRGIKTGSSSAAGGALSWAVYKTVGDETHLILGTMMDQHAKGQDLNGGSSLALVKENSRKVIEAIRGALVSATAIRKGQVVGYVDDRLGRRTQVVAAKDMEIVGVPGQKLRLELSAASGALPHSAGAGTQVGVLTVGSGNDAKRAPVVLRDNLVEPSFGTRLRRLG